MWLNTIMGKIYDTNIVVNYYYHYSLNADDEECDNDGVLEGVQSAQFGWRNDFSRFFFCYV